MQLIFSSRTNAQRGFSMVEVLVTMVIIAFGLLGVAGLLTTGLRNNQSSQLRTQASVLAYDMAERMRANRPAALNGEYALSSPGNPIAASDKTAWNAALAAKLPSGTGTITSTTASNLVVFQITVQWDDSKAVGGNTTEQFVFRGEI
jgi:type IV pilus assembly protein PilV